MSEKRADIALIGLAVMGQNIVLNMNDHGFTVCVFNRTVSKVDEFLAGPAKDTNVIGAQSLQEMVDTLKKPRRVMMLVKAGAVVDSFIDQLVPLLEQGDIIIDGGNSEYQDTKRRCHTLWQQHKLLYVGCGVSGGEEGARHGPSLMPGGHKDAWPSIQPIFQKICASADGEPCCDWVGDDGAGHFVKMVHNGIEYGDMQLICEAYQLLRDGLQLTHDQMSEVVTKWNGGELDSYLMEITANILRFRQPADGEHLLPLIRDCAGQKGTGKWTAVAALELGAPLTLIGESVFARCLSALQQERHEAARVLPGPAGPAPAPAIGSFQGDRDQFVEQIRQALYASKIVSYAQGFMLMREAAKSYGWNINYGGVALMWRGGCIIRSVFLGNIKQAFDRSPELSNLMLDKFFSEALARCQSAWRHVVATAVQLGVPVPCLATALAFYDGYRCPQLPANLLQAQRDYFGAHTYELSAAPGQFVHTNWTGTGGDVSASTYQV